MSNIFLFRDINKRDRGSFTVEISGTQGNIFNVKRNVVGFPLVPEALHRLHLKHGSINGAAE